MSQSKKSSNRLYVDVPMSTMRKLMLWSASRGEQKNSWARTILVLRCDENYPKVETWLEQEAVNLGVTKDELEKSLLQKMGFDFTSYEQEMLGEN